MSQRFVLFVEGHTEKQTLAAFLKRWLDPRLDEPVGIEVVRFEGWAEMVRDTPKKAERFLTSPKQSEIIAVVGLMDLYGPDIYPEDVTGVLARYKWLKRHMEEKVGSPRFQQFFAVHETEAWLLAGLGDFPTEVRRALEKKAAHPERVNFHTPPAKLLMEVFTKELKRDYKKVTEARNRFPKLDPEVAAAKCPLLNEMLEALLTMAQEARR